MKTRRIVLSVAAALLILAIAAVILFLTHSLDSIGRSQASAYDRYTALLEHLSTSEIALTEQGQLVGVYSLKDLGLLEDATNTLQQRFSDLERMPPEDFSALGAKARMRWKEQTHDAPDTLPLSLHALDITAPQRDLALVQRDPSEDAYLYFENGAFHICPEVQGNTLQPGVVEALFREGLADCAVTAAKPLQISLDLTDLDCYEPPQVLADSDTFDYAAKLQEFTQNFQISISLPGSSFVLQAAALLSVDEAGTLIIDEDGLRQEVTSYAAAFDKANTPYLFTTYDGSLKPLSFLSCTYTLDQEALFDQLYDQLFHLNGSPLEAPFTCLRNGQPFSISGTYVEVDIQNQQMTYYKDGEVLVHTDVVTGRKGGYDTPTGYYQVQTHSPNAWLSGPDYLVFVKYWVGFYQAYGIHDASWRTIFGGDKYIYDGSHGCVNTPEEAMAIIYNDITIGTPVVVH